MKRSLAFTSFLFYALICDNGLSTDSECEVVESEKSKRLRARSPVPCGRDSASTPEGVSTSSDARSFFGLTSKIPPLDSMLNFDADVKKIRPRVTNVKTA